MIENFEKIKKDLSELASIINNFKSEAVQLRLVELIFSGSRVLAVSDTSDQSGKHPIRGRQRKRRVKTTESSEGDKAAKSHGASGTGAVSTLMSVYETNFFGKPRTIGDVLEHCETNLARKIKANEISGKLGRMVRNGELKRTKNADGQYEYTKV
jgi:hypothetical protein